MTNANVETCSASTKTLPKPVFPICGKRFHFISVLSIHPSISCQSFSCTVEPMLARLGEKAGLHPGQVARLPGFLRAATVQARTRLFTTANLEWSISLMCVMSFHCGRQPENPESSQAGTRRTSKLHNKGPGCKRTKNAQRIYSEQSGSHADFISFSDKENK